MVYSMPRNGAFDVYRSFGRQRIETIRAHESESHQAGQTHCGADQQVRNPGRADHDAYRLRRQREDAESRLYRRSRAPVRSSQRRLMARARRFTLARLSRRFASEVFAMATPSDGFVREIFAMVKERRSF